MAFISTGAIVRRGTRPCWSVFAAFALCFPLAASNEQPPGAVSPGRETFIAESRSEFGGAGSSALVVETESNDTPLTATPLGVTPVRVRASLFRSPFTAVDVDLYSFTAAAGDRVYAATMTAASGGSADTVLDILAPDGTTVLETDDNDGSAGPNASTIAGLVLLTGGTYYVRVRQFVTASLEGTIRPYDLYVRVHSGVPVAETEPNDLNAPLPLAPSGWMSGAIGVANDHDAYAVSANAGDTIVVILDADPERDAPEWNPRLGLGPFNTFTAVVNGFAFDANTSAATFWTVKAAGTYVVFVDAPGAAGAPALTYHLSVSVLPGTPRSCTTYAGTTGPIADAGTTDFSLSVPHPTVLDHLRLSLNATHAITGQLDVSLVAPGGNEVVLFDDSSTFFGGPQPEIDFVLDDDAATPPGVSGGSFEIMSGVIFSPESYARLGYFKGQQAQGTWTLRVRDDEATYTGTVNAWSLSVCGPSAPPTNMATVFSTDFEAGDAGFTHGGTLDAWARGLPAGASAPITSCHSGTQCWKTNLTGPYSASSDQDLLSPPIDLTTIPAGLPVTLKWWQKYQLESASFDSAYVEVRQAGVPSSARRVWEWTGATMTRSVGTPDAAVHMSAGWGQLTADISSFAGTQVEIRFHLDANASGEFSGLAIDDVSIERRLPPNRSDFNGDGSGDIAVYRPSTGQWFIRNQGGVQFGDPSDVPVPGDYNGDHLVDIAVFRPSTGQWFVRNQFTVQFGDKGDVPVPGDFNGDGVTDVAVYRPSTGDWFVRNQFSVNFGGPGHVPIVGDYNGDGTDDVAVFQRSTGMWFVRNQLGFQFGDPGDRPVPGDYDGNGTTDIAVYRPSTGQWFVRNQFAVQFGDPGDMPVPRDYNGNGTMDVAIYRPSTHQWFVKDQLAVSFGDGRDMPVPLPAGMPLAIAGDFDGDGAADIAVHRPSTRQWFVRNQLAVQFGDPGDIPIPADYNGDRRMDIAVYRPTTGHWFVRSQPTVQFGDPSDKPVPGDYNGDGLMDVAVFRPSTGFWFVRNQFAVQFSVDSADVPVPGDYNGDGATDLAIFRPSNGQWFVRNVLALQFGDPGDIPVPADYNGDGKMDIAVYRPSTRTWFVRNQFSVQFGDSGDVAVPADYNGDGVTDIAVYRPSTGQWFVRNVLTVSFGDATHVPMVRIGGPQ